MPERLRNLLWDAVQANRWPIYVFGAQGRGKSCAMACVYQRCQDATRQEYPYKSPPQFIRLGEFTATIAQCRRNGSVTIPTPDGSTVHKHESDVWSKIRHAPLVCVDDVGVRQATPAAGEIFLQLLDLRLGKPLMLTGNHDMQGLRDCYDARTASRVSAGTMIELTGNDRRLENTAVFKV